MITTTIEWTGDPGDGLAHSQPCPPYMVEFGRGKSDTLLCMREFAPVVIVDGSPAMREAVGRSNIGPIVASYAVKARTPTGNRPSSTSRRFSSGTSNACVRSTPRAATPTAAG